MKLVKALKSDNLILIKNIGITCNNVHLTVKVLDEFLTNVYNKIDRKMLT